MGCALQTLDMVTGCCRCLRASVLFVLLWHRLAAYRLVRAGSRAWNWIFYLYFVMVV